MFKFLKNKIKDAVSKFSKSAETEEIEEEIEQTEDQVVQEQQVTEDSSKEDIQEDESSEESSVDEEEKDEVLVEESSQDEIESKVDKDDQPEPSESEDDLVKESNEALQKDFEEVEVSKDEAQETPQEEESIEDSKEVSEEKVTTDLAPEEPIVVEQETKNEVEEQSEELPVKETETIEDEKSKSLDEVLPKQDEIDDGEIEIPAPDRDEEPEVKEKKKGFFSKLFKKKEQEVAEPEIEKPTEPEPIVEEQPEKLPIEFPEEPAVEVPVETTEDIPAQESLEAKQEESVQEEPELIPEEPVKPEVEEKEDTKSVVAQNLKEDIEITDTTKKKKGFFGKIKQKFVKFKLTEEAFDELFWEFELALLENNVAVQVIEKIKADLHEKLTQEQVSKSGIEQTIMETLKESIEEILDIPSFDLLQKVKEKKPLVICIVGVNGSGKTTTIGKLIHYFKEQKKSLVVAAADTFRAAAIQQLEEHTTKLDVKLIKQDYGADAAAVAFDAIQHAKAKDLDVVLIDTAGRLQSNSNLMDELKKLIRVNKPDLNIFIGESITGNDCVEQAVAFNEAVGIDGLILSKADIDEKGGAALSVSYVTKKPILFFGMGQTYDDLKPFNKQEVLQSLGFE